MGNKIPASGAALARAKFKYNSLIKLAEEKRHLAEFIRRMFPGDKKRIQALTRETGILFERAENYKQAFQETGAEPTRIYNVKVGGKRVGILAQFPTHDGSILKEILDDDGSNATD